MFPRKLQIINQKIISLTKQTGKIDPFGMTLCATNCKPSLGFSIIELMVVISIIGIMSGLMFANYRQGERDTALEYAAQQMAQDIRQAQNLSLAGPKDTYGYGIHIEKSESEYFIYGDEGIKNKTHQYNNIDDEKVSPYSILLSPNIIINDITTNPTSTIADIFFAPPDPVTYINGSNISNGEAKIEICLVITNKCKTITVTTAGRVEVN